MSSSVRCQRSSIWVKIAISSSLNSASALDISSAMAHSSRRFFGSSTRSTLVDAARSTRCRAIGIGRVRSGQPVSRMQHIDEFLAIDFENAVDVQLVSAVPARGRPCCRQRPSGHRQNPAPSPPGCFVCILSFVVPSPLFEFSRNSAGTACSFTCGVVKNTGDPVLARATSFAGFGVAQTVMNIATVPVELAT